MLDYITPDIVHVMLDGRIIETGGAALADAIEQTGYDQYRSEAAAT
jgi:Fe-S cluster assembly ATP-binding protein